MGYKLKYRASEINTLLDVVKNDVMDKNLVEKSQLTQSDASEWDDTKLSYIKNRTHYEEARTFTAPFELGVPHGVVGEITIIYADQEASVNIGESIRLTSATGGIVTITYSDTGVIFATESEPSITEDSPITVKYCKPLDEKFLPSSVATKDDIIKTYKTDFTVFDLIELANGNIDSIAISKEFYEAVLRGDVIVVGTGGGQGGNIANAECSVMEDYTRIKLSLILRYSWLEALITVDNASMEGNVDFAICHNLQGLLVDGENFSTINGQSLLSGGNIVINEPYLAPFSVADLDEAIVGFYPRFPKDEFIEAVTAGRPLVVPIHDNDRSGITASYYLTPATAETGKGIVVDILHSSKVYHLTLEDIPEQPFFVVGPDNVSCKDLGSNTFVVPYTFSEIQRAHKSRTKLHVDSDFVDAIRNKKLILIPTGKTIADGQYMVAYYASSMSTDALLIHLKIHDPSYSTNDMCCYINFKGKDVAPTDADVILGETKLVTSSNLFSEYLSSIYYGNNFTTTRPNSENIVGSIDYAFFINNGETTAMTPNTVYNFVNNGVNRTIAVYDDHRLVITSENNSTVALSPGVTYTSKAKIIPSALPSSLVTKPELRANQADWSAEEGDKGHIKNRTHYPKVLFKAELGRRFTLKVAPDYNARDLSDYKLWLNNKFYEFDESVPVGGTMTIGSDENQQADITFVGETTSGNVTNYSFTITMLKGFVPDSSGRITLPIVVKGKTLDPLYLPELRGDWEEMDSNSTTFINNKTHSAPVYYPFIVGERISLIEDKDKHTIDNYRVRYEDKLYALPTEIGGEAYIPSVVDWKFKVVYEFYNEDDTKSIYSLSSYANPDITLENASVEIITDLPVLGGKKLDEFYISKDIARVDDIEKLGFTKNKGTVTAVIVNNKKKTPDSDGVIDVGEIKTDKADFATDLTGVVEATPELFTYRPSAGDKSVRDESAVIRRIKGNTSVWGQGLNLALDQTGENGWWFRNPEGGGNVRIEGNIVKYDVIPEKGSNQQISQKVGTFTVGHIYLLHFTFNNNGVVNDYWRRPWIAYFSQNKYGEGESIYAPQNGLTSGVVDIFHTVETEGLQYIILKQPYISISDSEITPTVMEFGDIQLFDLTDLFGAGNEPTTYEEFRKYYPDAYYPYCEPEIRSMRATGIQTVGFNLFDEAKVFSEAGMTLTNDGWQGEAKNVYRKLWSNDFGYSGQICVYMKSLAVNGSPNFRVRFHYTDGTKSDTYSQLASVGTQKEGFAISDNGKVVDYINGYYGSAGEVLINKLCINLSHSGVRNGEYKSYEKNTLLLPEIAKYFPDGMQGIGDVCDEIIDGLAIQRCDVRAYEEGDENNAEVKTDKTITVYKLSEPIYTHIAEPLQLDYKVDDFGTEKMLSDAPSSPFKADIVYQFNAEGRIRDNSRNIERLEEQLNRTKEDIQNAGVQSDWLDDNPDSKAYIKNKPTMPTQVATAPEVIETTSTPSSMLPNVVYIVFAGLVRFTLPTLVDGDANAHNVWKIIFISPASANLTFPENVAWKDGIAPNWSEAGGYCELTFTKFYNFLLGEWKLYK